VKDSDAAAMQRINAAPSIEAIGALLSVEDMREELRRAGTACGHINSVVHLPRQRDGNDCEFLVTFDNTQDAMAASRKWHCCMYGFTSVLVSVKRQEAAESAG
jgi:hypothetical protein